MCHDAVCHYAVCHYAVCHYAVCHYAESHYAESNNADCLVLCFDMLNINMLEPSEELSFSVEHLKGVFTLVISNLAQKYRTRLTILVRKSRLLFSSNQ